jgi:hypothetical protein
VTDAKVDVVIKELGVGTAPRNELPLARFRHRDVKFVAVLVWIDSPGRFRVKASDTFPPMT